MFAEPRVWEDTLRMTANQQPSFLLLADPFSFETETFVRGLDRVYPLAPKIGGLASGARQVGGTALYLGNQVHHSGCVTLALTGNIELDAVVAQGCRPIGDPMFVTMAHENLIRELDGRPPREVLARLFERLPPNDRELFSQSLFLGLAMRTDASEYLPGDFLIRNILGMDPQSGALWVSANVPANSVVQFHLRDAATSAHDLERTLTGYGARVRCRPTPARCCSRAAAAAWACTVRPITTAMPSAGWSATCRSAASSATARSARSTTRPTCTATPAPSRCFREKK